MNGKLLILLLVFVVSAVAAPEYPNPVLDYRADRDLASLKKTLNEKSGQVFFEELNVFVRRYGYVPALAELYVEWAEKQTRISDAALLHAEILRRWPKLPETQKAAVALSEFMLLTEPWSLNDQLAILREFSQRLVDSDDPTPEPTVVIAIAKVLLKANEPGQARACVAAALARPESDGNFHLQLLNAESYRTAGDLEAASDMFDTLLNQSLSARQSQAAAIGFLRSTSKDDPRTERAKETLRNSDPDNLTAHSIK
ncbi:MAG: hypothetical protein ABIH23_06290 [bacterium]